MDVSPGTILAWVPTCGPLLAAEVRRRARPLGGRLHRARGETTKPIERSHAPVKDRLGAMRGLRSIATGQRGARPGVLTGALSRTPPGACGLLVVMVVDGGSRALLRELEPLRHVERVRRMVEIGRRAAALVAALESGGTYERWLALVSCFGSRDAAHALRALTDSSRLVRGLAITLVPLLCT